MEFPGFFSATRKLYGTYKLATKFSASSLTGYVLEVDRSPFDQCSIAAAVMLVPWVFPVLTNQQI